MGEYSPYLPSECLQEIFKYIDENDTKTLYSILLVNRLWCSNIVSILWRNPFKNQKEEKISYKILLTLLSYNPFTTTHTLSSTSTIDNNDDDKEQPIIKSFKESTILTRFDYPYFIKKLDLTNMLKMIFYLTEDKKKEEIKFKNLKKYNNSSSIFEKIWKIITSNSNIETLIINTIDCHKFSKYLEPFFKIPETKKCFSTLKSLTLKLKPQDSLILSELINCINDKIKDIELEISYKSTITCFDSDLIINLISSQKNLEKFHYKDDSGNLFIYPIILKLRDHSHSIKSLTLEQSCSIDVDLFSSFENFYNLQELSFKNFNFEGNHDLFSNIKFPKLKSLSFDDIKSRNQQYMAYVSEPIMNFIQNHSTNLNHLSMNVLDVIMKDTFKTISQCCSNLTSFSCATNDQNDMKFIYLIFKNNPYLKSIDLCIIFPIRNSILETFAREIPESINNITIGYSILGKVQVNTFLKELKCDKLKSFKFNWQNPKNVDIDKMAREISKDKGWIFKGCELKPTQYQRKYIIEWE
ncbi:uncharacterized protein OCT59_021698 [Rhizophagus irregularis]|uniref:F-box domain-containing protein n=4 Tax=Rhizophagus irregularis TaxID=588596 RepID=A0A015LR31_RHIIW|nr:hypothetical protein RirG_044490 [Rhizophagus irregularis DAOM 197198w]UZO28156.1 hypothetical protein OCT59_021698 [Rhizophagus irregularis]GBC30482.1 hypothetical protein GLOIN_2v1705857 [Rhizophagus irregularis DAOM 181602=DAOM 197198]